MILLRFSCLLYSVHRPRLMNARLSRVIHVLRMPWCDLATTWTKTAGDARKGRLKYQFVDVTLLAGVSQHSQQDVAALCKRSKKTTHPNWGRMKNSNVLRMDDDDQGDQSYVACTTTTLLANVKVESEGIGWMDKSRDTYLLIDESRDCWANYDDSQTK